MKNKCVYICIALIPIVAYIFNFRNLSISKDPEKWAFFGDYIGGVYSVVLTCILTFLMYQLNKKDEALKEKKEFAKVTFQKINEFNSEIAKLDSDKVDEFRKFIIDNEFIISNESVFRELIDIGDYYLSLCSDTCNRDFEKEKRVKLLLKEMYNGQ